MMESNLPFPHKTHQPLSEFSSFGIGGPARYFAEAHSIPAMQEMLKYAGSHELPIFILGKGSNCLFDDKGYNGLVILNRIDYLHSKPPLFTAGSGYSFARIGRVTAKLGFCGLEFAAGIPATVGGAIYMNAGAWGQETKDSLVQVSFVDQKGELHCLKKEELSFSYRTSSFQNLKGAIVEGVFELKTDPHAKETQKKSIEYRLHSQPYKSKSAGCAFRNPEKSFAGKLIEECGLKGLKIGGAAVSSLHANFIVNEGGASAQDVLEMIKHIKERVFKEKGIHLEHEIRYVAYDG